VVSASYCFELYDARPPRPEPDSWLSTILPPACCESLAAAPSLAQPAVHWRT